jgi:hypothetical protein
MKNYLVEIRFKTGPAFATVLSATCSELAKAEAVALAKQSGMTRPITRTNARRMQS